MYAGVTTMQSDFGKGYLGVSISSCGLPNSQTAHLSYEHRIVHFLYMHCHDGIRESLSKRTAGDDQSMNNAWSVKHGADLVASGRKV